MVLVPLPLFPLVFVFLFYLYGRLFILFLIFLSGSYTGTYIPPVSGPHQVLVYLDRSPIKGNPFLANIQDPLPAMPDFPPIPDFPSVPSQLPPPPVVEEDDLGILFPELFFSSFPFLIFFLLFVFFVFFLFKFVFISFISIIFFDFRRLAMEGHTKDHVPH